MSKASNKILAPPLGESVYPERPWQRILIDFMGPYPRSKNGSTYIFVVLDHLTKFVLLKPITTATSKNIISYLRSEVFLLFGVPETIVSDNGPQFKCKVFSEFLSSFNIRHIKTAIYSPQSNASERVNRSILAAIRSYIDGDHKNWDKFLPDIASALRDSIHQSSKYSPHFLMFGYHKITDGRLYNLLKEIKCVGEGDIELPINNRLQIIHNEVGTNLENAFKTYSKRYKLRTRQRQLELGEKVYVRKHSQSNASRWYSAKLDYKFKPAIIKTRIGNKMYECEDESKKSLGVFHIKDIKQSSKLPN